MDNLIDYNLNQDPLISFLDWHKSALELEQNADAMAVSTYDLHKNRPNTRYLLFKGVVDKKIIFYKLPEIEIAILFWAILFTPKKPTKTVLLTN